MISLFVSKYFEVIEGKISIHFKPTVCILFTPSFQAQNVRLYKKLFLKILTLCMISIQERFQIKSGLQWHRYGSPELAQALDFFLDPMSLLKALYVYQFQNLCHWYGHFLVFCLFLFSRPYLCSRPYVFFCQIFPALRLFRTLE